MFSVGTEMTSENRRISSPALRSMLKSMTSGGVTSGMTTSVSIASLPSIGITGMLATSSMVSGVIWMYVSVPFTASLDLALIAFRSVASSTIVIS